MALFTMSDAISIIVNKISSIGYTTIQDNINDDKRSAAVQQKTIFQFDRDRLPSGSMCMLKGLTMNVTGPDDGTATFSSPGCNDKNAKPGFDNVEGEVNGHLDGPVGGLQRGNLSFTIPGLEPVALDGSWVIVPPTEEYKDKEVESAFEELHSLLKSVGSQPNGAADVVEKFVRVRATGE